MDNNYISFENLSRTVAHLVSYIAEIKFLVERKEPLIIPVKRIPINIVEACQIIGKSNRVQLCLRKRKGSNYCT